MTAVLNWNKANWLIVLFAVIMLVSLPTFFVVGEGMKAKNRDEIASRVKQQEDRIRKVEKVSVQIQPLVPDAPAFDEQLPISQNVVDRFREIRGAIKEDADAIEGLALEINDRSDDVLVPGLFPDLAPQAVSLRFRIYSATVDKHEQMLRRINAGMPLPHGEVFMQLREFDATYRRSQLNAEPGEALTPSDREKLDDAMKQARMGLYKQRASDLSVYADVNVFNLEPWDSGVEPDAIRMFNWQFLTWVHGDIIQAIRLANTGDDGELLDVIGSGGRPGAVVKRIESIVAAPFAGSRDRRASSGEDAMRGNPANEMIMTPRGRGFAPEGGRGMPGLDAGPRGGATTKTRQVDDPSQLITFHFDESVTGRVSNALYDVRAVQLTAIVDSTRLPVLLDAISSTNFMTVTGINLQQVDPFIDLSEGFLYGSDPVVRVTLDIETIWLRPWMDTLMPREVKLDLGIIKEEIEEEDDRPDAPVGRSFG